MLSDVLELTWCLCRGTKFMGLDACVGVCIATAECSGLFLTLVFEAGKMVTGLLHQCRHAFASAFPKLH